MVDRSGGLVLAAQGGAGATCRFEQRSCPMKVFEDDKPGWMVQGGRAQLFAIVQSGIVQFKAAVLIDPLGYCCSAVFLHESDHILESSG